MAALKAGMRVIVRHRIPGPLPLTDALGELLAVDAVSATVQTKRGDVVILRADIVAAKEVPPAPLPRTRRFSPAPTSDS